MTVSNEVGTSTCPDCFEVVVLPPEEEGIVTITSPANNASIPQGLGATPVTMTVDVDGVVLGANSYYLRYYVDGGAGYRHPPRTPISMCHLDSTSCPLSLQVVTPHWDRAVGPI